MRYHPSFNGTPSGLYIIGPPVFGSAQPPQTYLPQLSLQAKASILSSVARTTFTQTFSNPLPKNIPELRYTFPLYDGVSVASFTCTINGDRVIKGVVQEKQQARQTFDEATARGQTAGLLEQLPSASDVFTTTIGNVPGNAEIKVEIVVLGELKHDAETDGIRFTIPTHIAPRYGAYLNTLADSSGAVAQTKDITIIVDVEMPTGSTISSLQSPSHPIAVGIGSLSTSTGSFSSSPNLASASLALGQAPLDKDFVLQVVAANTDNPVAVLETHPTIPNQRALMTTLVPKFNLPPQRPEIVFICDRSGSMGGRKIANLGTALQLFLKSLPLGVQFNVCGFGSHYNFLFPQSQPYSSETLAIAMRYAETIAADYGGTEIHNPLADAFKRRLPDTDLEVFLLTDGQVWNQDHLIQTVNSVVEDSQGTIRLFTLAIGSGVSHSLVQGLARAGKGFSQAVGDNEMMEKKVVRMLKGALTPHINDYTLEVKYKKPEKQDISDDDDEFDLVDRVADLTVDISPVEKAIKKEDDVGSTSVPGVPTTTQPISLFDPNFDPNVQIESSGVVAASPADLPAVTIPKILQAPSDIPPLYPFNRTSVYLIMSPDTGDKIPEAVVLRATCKHGPLELEIPVLTTTTGETIHQLAARKAVHELEEGRGWIFRAKAKTGDVLLKDLYKDQFAAMVEREAVRLGVQFQVAGKWCSFVAVEENDSDDNNDDDDGTGSTATTNPITELQSGSKDEKVQPKKKLSRHSIIRNTAPPPAAPAPAPFASAYAFGTPTTTASQGGALFASGMANDAPGHQSFMPQTRYASPDIGSISHKPTLFGGGPSPAASTFGARVSPFGAPVPAAATTAGGLFGGMSLRTQDSSSLVGTRFDGVDSITTTTTGGRRFAQMSAFAGAPKVQPGGGLFGSNTTSVPPPTNSSLFAAAPNPFLSPSSTACSLGGSSSSGSSGSGSSGGGGGVGGLFGAPAASGGLFHATPAAKLDETTLQKIIRLQDFSGFWVLQPEILQVIHVTPERFDKLLWAVPMHAASTGDAVTDRLAVAATMAVVVFLRTQLGSEKDAWELVVEKALAWLEMTYGTQESVGQALAEAENILK